MDLSVKTDDFFLYGQTAKANYFSGFLTSHPSFKRYVRASSGFLQASRSIHALASGDASVVDEQLMPLWHAMGVVQVCWYSQVISHF